MNLEKLIQIQALLDCLVQNIIKNGKIIVQKKKKKAEKEEEL